MRHNLPILWTADDDAVLLALRAEGNTFAAIGDVLNRTESSVQKRHSRLTGSCAIVFATRRLGEAMIEAQIRYARGKSLLENQETLMGGVIPANAIPGTECIHKTSSAERLAA